MITEKQLRQARKSLEKERKQLLARAQSPSSVLNPADERDTDEADIIVNIQTRAQELWAKDGWQQRLYEIDHALQRMDEGGYGQCEICGEEIDPDRLLILPETTVCVRCRERVEKRMYASDWDEETADFVEDEDAETTEDDDDDDVEDFVLGDDDDR
ncbi:MAG: TraR/DksA family transcriptional regulator [Chloroflexi bacterium]|nr:TraR/DksA family transcriptional regulator [Chloroflexota bacterium]